MVDAYRARWVIEELFKALKTGCQIEKRQMESYGALRIALALFLPIAVRLLALRDAARSEPDAPACAREVVAAFGAVVQDLGLLGQRLVGHGASFIARMSLPVASVSRA